jgi:hypothetical protein
MTVNAGYNMNSPNLKRILEMITEDQPQPLTKQEKQELINTLKFTPRKYNIYISGSGGESYAGTVSKEI